MTDIIQNITWIDGDRSIDEASEKLENSIEKKETREFNIPPETEFWAHCSNLQAWVENNYDTQLLHNNLAFPLLKRLTAAGDPKALNVFKFEILKRFIEGSDNTREFLNEQKYIDYLSEEEFRSALNIKELSTLEKLEKNLQVGFTFAKNLEYITGIDGIKRDNLYYYDKFNDANITGLRIFKEGLKKIPEMIAHFKKLKYLVLSHNLSESLPDSIGSLNKLELLDLSSNNFEIFQNLSKI